MNEIIKNQMVIKMRSGVEKWIDADKAKQLQEILPTITSHKFISVDGETLNTADLEGVYTPGTLEDNTKRKNGQWKCKGSNWHDKSEKCNCASNSEAERARKNDEAARNCKSCMGKRFLMGSDNQMHYCHCQTIL